MGVLRLPIMCYKRKLSKGDEERLIGVAGHGSHVTARGASLRRPLSEVRVSREDFYSAWY